MEIRRTIRSVTVIFFAAVLTLGPLTTADATDGQGRRAQLTVMTRNIYVGGDITRPIEAASGQTGTAALVALARANHALRNTVDQTDFPTRSRLLAREIARTRPDLIGLQEVALWRHGPLELDQPGVLNAEEVDYDFLELLLKALRRQGIRYDVASVQAETDVEAPAFAGGPGDAEARDVRLTVSDVILVRRHADLRILDHGGGQYQARINVSVGGLPLSIVRGYAWVDVRTKHARFRLISTHLESQSSDLALAQARELVAGPARPPGTAIIVCDCNSDPLRTGVRDGDHVPFSAPYEWLTANGFEDQWLEQRQPVRPGLTAVLSELVNDSSTARFDRRIDFVLARSSEKSTVEAVRGVLTGNRLSDRDRATGLWPADHAGVVLHLRLRESRPGA